MPLTKMILNKMTLILMPLGLTTLRTMTFCIVTPSMTIPRIKIQCLTGKQCLANSHALVLFTEWHSGEWRYAECRGATCNAYIRFLDHLLQFQVIVTFCLKKDWISFFFAVLLQMNCNDYSCIEGVWLFLILNFFSNVCSISNQSFADARSSNITRLPPPMPMACQEH